MSNDSACWSTCSMLVNIQHDYLKDEKPLGTKPTGKNRHDLVLVNINYIRGCLLFLRYISDSKLP